MKLLCNALLIALILTACSETEKQEETTSFPSENTPALTIIDKGIKTLPIADDASFEQLREARVTELNGKEYFSFFYQNMYDMFLYLYDYETGEILNKMTFVIEGPNAFNASINLNYFIHTLDSIFVGNTNGDYAIMNDKAEIIHKIGKEQQGLDRGDVKFDETSYFDGTLIHASTLQGYPYRDVDFQYTRATMEPKVELNLTRRLPTDSFVRNLDAITASRKAAARKGGSQIPVSRQVHRGNSKLYTSNPMSDSIFVFDQNYELINTLYAGVLGIDVTDYEAYLKMMQVKYFKGGSGRESVMNQPPYFIRSAIDPQGKFIYRVLIEETKGQYSERADREIPIAVRARLVVIDLASGELYTYPLPLNEIDLWVPIDYRSFVSNTGIHFRVKDQENEDQVQFRVFGMDNIH